MKVNSPAVVAEIIDGEAVIMDLSTGHYFSTQHVGCDIWRGIELGMSRAAIANALSAHYGIDPAVASQAVTQFIGDLVDRNLVVETDGADGPTDVSWLVTNGTTFAPPVLNSYTDMEELLLLDPIHDVDQSGWPMPKAPDAA